MGSYVCGFDGSCGETCTDPADDNTGLGNFGITSCERPGWKRLESNCNSPACTQATAQSSDPHDPCYDACPSIPYSARTGLLNRARAWTVQRGTATSAQNAALELGTPLPPCTRESSDSDGACLYRCGSAAAFPQATPDTQITLSDTSGAYQGSATAHCLSRFTDNPEGAPPRYLGGSGEDPADTAHWWVYGTSTPQLASGTATCAPACGTSGFPWQNEGTERDCYVACDAEASDGTTPFETQRINEDDPCYDDSFDPTVAPPPGTCANLTLIRVSSGTNSNANWWFECTPTWDAIDGATSYEAQMRHPHRDPSRASAWKVVWDSRLQYGILTSTNGNYTLANIGNNTSSAMPVPAIYANSDLNICSRFEFRYRATGPWGTTPWSSIFREGRTTFTTDGRWTNEHRTLCTNSLDQPWN